jgi:hypothetical protein
MGARERGRGDAATDSGRSDPMKRCTREPMNMFLALFAAFYATGSLLLIGPIARMFAWTWHKNAQVDRIEPERELRVLATFVALVVSFLWPLTLLSAVGGPTRRCGRVAAGGGAA